MRPIAADHHSAAFFASRAGAVTRFFNTRNRKQSALFKQQARVRSSGCRLRPHWRGKRDSKKRYEIDSPMVDFVCRDPCSALRNFIIRFDDIHYLLAHKIKISTWQRCFAIK
jgi:hypothetical protein